MQYYNNFTGLGTGNYTYTAYAQDLAGNVNATAERNVVVDLTGPGVTLVSPADGIYTGNASLNLTASLTDDFSGILNATLFIYNSTGLNTTSVITGFAASTLSAAVGVVVQFIDGIYTWFWSAFDVFGNEGVSANRTITFDTTIPLVNFTKPTPSNGSTVSGSFEINISITDTNLINLTYNFNGTEIWYNISNESFVSYGSGLWSFNITQTGLPADGASYYYNITVVDRSGHRNTTETRYISTNVAPSFSLITNSPNISASLDPGLVVLIETNISDADYNMDSAILQWKNYTAEWTNATNVSMINQTPVDGIELYQWYNASFVLPDYEDNISYRIWTNDTLGSSRTSGIYNLSSNWDCNWTLTPVSAGSFAGWDINKWIFNISINNTGDVLYPSSSCSLSFQTTYDLTQGRVYLDNSKYKGKQYLGMAAGTNQTIEVNTTFGSEVNSESFVISIEEISTLTVIPQINSSGTLVTTQNGPYIDVEITSPLEEVATYYLTDQTISLNGYITNIMGDNTEGNGSYNVSFNWTLPAGLINSSGSTYVNHSNLSDKTVLNYNQINITFSDLESMAQGAVTLTLSGYGVNSSGQAIVDAINQSVQTDEKTLSFACYNTSDDVCVASCGFGYDEDCEQVVVTNTVTTGTAGGGSGGGGSSGGGAAIRTDADFELLAGNIESFTFPVCNPYKGTRTSVRVAVSGINAEYVNVVNSELGTIESGECKDLKIKITAPAYFTKGKYLLILDISGHTKGEDGLLQTYTEKKRVTLHIVEVNGVEANKMVNSSLDYLSEMQSRGLNIEDMTKFVKEIETSFNDFEFSDVKSKFEAIEQYYEAALGSQDLLEDLTTKINNAANNGIDVIESRKLLYLAETAFNRGDYVLAYERLQEAQLTYALEVKGEFNLIYSVKNNPVQSLGIILLASAIGLTGSLLIRLKLYKRKFVLLTEEEKLLLELMKVVQRECFENKHMSMEEYGEAMAQYEKRLSETVEDKIRVETRIANLMKLRSKKHALLEERKRLTSLIRELQNDYLNKGKIETRVYENMVRSYTTRLSSVEEEITFIEAQKVLEGTRFTGKVKNFFRRLFGVKR